MQESPRFIDVIATAKVSMKTEGYRATVSFTVSAGRRQSCLSEALILRDKVIVSLRDAGIADGDIEEGGGSVKERGWAGRKDVEYHIYVSHQDMSVLAQAMAKVESIFAAVERPWFSGIKQDFSFSSPIPQLVPDSTTSDELLKRAVLAARVKAQALAQEAGMKIDGVRWIIETPYSDDQDAMKGQLGYMGSDSDDGLSIDCLLEAMPQSYLPVAPKKAFGRYRFRIRFAVSS